MHEDGKEEKKNVKE